MSAQRILDALELPGAARVDRRVPKSLLLEHGTPTAADRRRINDGIERVTWVAALKPTTIGVPAYTDAEREYLEIAVLHLSLRPAAKPDRLAELVHRAVPYPVLAVAELANRSFVSLAHKRWSRGEAGRTVLDEPPTSVDCTAADDEPHDAAFLAALALGRQPRGTLYTVYQGWLDALLALQAARRSGSFEVPAYPEVREARRDALQQIAHLDAEVARLRAAAAKEKQIARQVDLNLELERTEAARAALLTKL